MKIVKRVMRYFALMAMVWFGSTAPLQAQSSFISPVTPLKILTPPAVPGGYNSIVSTDGRFRLTFQSDGNLVLYQGGTALWASDTVLHVPTGGYSVLQTRYQVDGNLVVYWYYAGSEVPVWASNTDGNTGTTLAVQNDGNVVIYNAAGAAIWATNTCCR